LFGSLQQKWGRNFTKKPVDSVTMKVRTLRTFPVWR